MDKAISTTDLLQGVVGETFRDVTVCSLDKIKCFCA